MPPYFHNKLCHEKFEVLARQLFHSHSSSLATLQITTNYSYSLLKYVV